MGAEVIREDAIEFTEVDSKSLGLSAWVESLYGLRMEIREARDQQVKGRNVYKLWGAVIKRVQVSLVGRLDGGHNPRTVVLSAREYEVFMADYRGQELDNPYEFILGEDYKERLSYDKQGMTAQVVGWINGTYESLQVVELRSNKEVMKGHIQMSAAIRAYGRMQMAEVLREVEKAGGIWYYVDTDGVILNRSLQKVLPEVCGQGLGQWKNASPGGEIIEKAVFLALKRYGYVTRSGKEHVALAGIPGKGVRFERLVKMMRAAEVVGWLWVE